MEKKTDFIEKYRFRAGIEAAFSYSNTLTGIKKLRVRGLSAVRFGITLQALAANIFRATTARKAVCSRHGSNCCYGLPVGVVGKVVLLPAVWPAKVAT